MPGIAIPAYQDRLLGKRFKVDPPGRTDNMARFGGYPYGYTAGIFSFKPLDL